MIFWTRPWAFWLFVPAVGAALLAAAHFRWKSRTLGRLGDPALLRRLVDPRAARRQRVKTRC